MVGAETFTDKEKHFFKQALYCNQLRGDDSTGIFTVDKELITPRVGIFKKAYPAADFMQLQAAKNIMNISVDKRVIVGHNRAATRGATTDDNAHPFQHKNITMVHNGTLTNTFNLVKSVTYNRVDSDILCQAISEGGIQEAVNNCTGAYALVWHDASDNTLNLLRNNQRPFSIAYDKVGKHIYFASEILMLQWLLDRNGVLYDDILVTGENKHLRLELGKNLLHSHIRTVEKKSSVIYSKQNINAKQQKKVDKKEKKRKEKLKKEIETKVASSNDKREIPRVGDTQEAYFYQFENYKGNSTAGYWIGTMSEEPWLTCQIHNRTADVFEVGLYSFQVVNVGFEDDPDKDPDFVLRGVAPQLEVSYTEPDDSFKEEPVKKEVAAVIKKPYPSTSKTLSTSKKQGGGLEKKFLPSPTESQQNNGKTGRTTCHSKSLEEAMVDTKDILGDSERVADQGDEEDVYVSGPGGIQCSEQVFNTLTTLGCSNCGANLELEDAPTITWRDGHTPICEECQISFEVDERDEYRSYEFWGNIMH